MEHAPHNAMVEPAEIARFRDRCSAFMGALLDELATTPGEPRSSTAWRAWVDDPGPKDSADWSLAE